MEQVTKIFLEIFSISAVRYFVLAGIPFLLFYLFFNNKMKHLKIQQRQAARKDFWREIWHSMQSTFVFTIIIVILAATPVRQYTQIYTNVSDYPVWWIPVSVALALVIHDTYFYWFHRLMHHPKIFKYTHLVHHKSTNPSPWTSYSFHMLEAVAEGGVLAVLVFVMPMHGLGILWFTIAAFIINVYGHLGYEIMPKGLRKSFLFEIINTSVHHNLHHSKFKGNYGLYFRYWDRMMGTENPDYVKEYDKIQAQRFGQEAVPAKVVAEPVAKRA
ncbi:sterol desaturase family protein [Pseudoflavitalea rhizosphaerae]|uniref:sterol desaturase family protein n=1 Tax=Pseudoflavitalea rhizosphaerae TaxID=1884793 RepID=UPI000F8DB115|nr:sterol desaturase family protein [Pseudoflavitalea rhizosphaerae]